MIDLLILWIGLLVALLAFAVGPPGRGGALTLAYFLDMSLIHVPGVFVFLDDASGLADFADTSLRIRADARRDGCVRGRRRCRSPDRANVARSRPAIVSSHGVPDLKAWAGGRW